MRKLAVVGIGPGNYENMTIRADRALRECDVIVGYTVYVDLVKERYADKEFLATPMLREVERCEMALETARGGKTVAMICSGDSGIYGMAALLYELRGEAAEPEIEVIPGLTAACSGGALLGAPARAALFAAVRADKEQNEHEQHEKGCEPDADDGDRAHRRDLHTRSADGEGEVAAHRAGVDILPRAALADVDAKITAVLGREVADGVLRAAIVGKVELPLLEHLAVGGMRREFSAPQAGEVALQTVEERAGLYIEGLGRERLGGQLDGVAVAVAALDKQDGKPALACLLGGETGGIGLYTAVTTVSK